MFKLYHWIFINVLVHQILSPSNTIQNLKTFYLNFNLTLTCRRTDNARNQWQPLQQPSHPSISFYQPHPCHPPHQIPAHSNKNVYILLYPQFTITTHNFPVYIFPSVSTLASPQNRAQRDDNDGSSCASKR